MEKAPFQTQRHAQLSTSPPSDKELQVFTLASKAPILSTSEKTALDFLNQESLGLNAPGKANRKRSRSKDDAVPELAKRLRTRPVHAAIGTDLTRTHFNEQGGKLERPPAGLVERGPSVPVNRSDIFEIDSGENKRKESSDQALEEPKRKRGRPPKNKERSVNPAVLIQADALKKSDIDATSTAPRHHARKQRSPESKTSYPEVEQQQPFRRTFRNGAPKSTLVGQLGGRRLRSRQPVANQSKGTSSPPVDNPDFAHSPPTGQNGVIQEGQPPSRGDTPEDTQSLRKTKDGTLAVSEPQSPRPDVGKDNVVSRIDSFSQVSARTYGSNDDEGKSVARINVEEDNEQDHNVGENSNAESNEQGNSGHDSESAGTEDQESGPESADDSEIASGGHDLELFGEDDAWKKINEARREIGFSRVDGRKEIPSLKTRTGKEIVRRIKTLAEAYDPTDQVTSSVRPRGAFKKLSRCIEDLSEDSCMGNENEVAQALYAHAIPEFVLLLFKALRARSTQLSQSQSNGALEEIIELQEALIMLCEKATDWKARPPKSRPIINPTRTILPQAKAMRKAFGRVLGDRKRLPRKQASEAHLTPDMDAASTQRESERKRRADAAIWEHIADDGKRGSETQWGRKPARQDEPGTRQMTAQPAPTQRARTMQEAIEGWSKEEKRELLTELVDKKEYWHLTGKTWSH
ncbi:MAG: hypothetical protein Q9169_000755 [Polycauliona sp. 2 TL-2023]